MYHCWRKVAKLHEAKKLKNLFPNEFSHNLSCSNYTNYCWSNFTYISLHIFEATLQKHHLAKKVLPIYAKSNRQFRISSLNNSYSNNLFSKTIIMYSNCKFFVCICALHTFCIPLNILRSLAFVRHLIKAFIFQCRMVHSVMSGTAINADMVLHQITSLYSKYI